MLTNKPNRRTQRKEEEDLKHLRKPASRTALEKLRQARRCEQFALRVDMMVKREASMIHEKLNKDAMMGITKAVDVNIEWGSDLAQSYTKIVKTVTATRC